MIRYWWLGLIFIAMLLLPLFIGEFWVHVAIEILILGLFAMSFNMIFGYMGQLSFGHAAYFGAGAYATGLLMVKASVPLPVCLAVSMITAGLLALVIGFVYHNIPRTRLPSALAWTTISGLGLFAWFGALQMMAEATASNPQLAESLRWWRNEAGVARPGSADPVL